MTIYTWDTIIPKNTHYWKRYHRFITYCKSRPQPNGYVEWHHIIPRSMGGSDDSENLIALTAREHYLAHWILARALGGSMTAAFILMNSPTNKYNIRYHNSRLYEAGRCLYIEYLKSDANPLRGRPNESARKYNTQRVLDGTHNLLKCNNNPVYRLIEEGTHRWLQPEHKQRCKDRNIQLVEQGKHPFQGENNPSRRLAKQGLHHTQNPEWVKENSPWKRPWSCEYCGVEGNGLQAYSTWHNNGKCLSRNTELQGRKSGPKRRKMPIEVNGVRYESILEAANAHGIAAANVQYLLSKPNSGWKRLAPKHLQNHSPRKKINPE